MYGYTAIHTSFQYLQIIIVRNLFSTFSGCFNKRCYMVSLKQLRLMHRSSTDEWRPTASSLCFLSLLCKKADAGIRLQLSSKWSTKGLSSENFLTTSAYFKCNIYHITMLSWMKKERTKKNEQFCFWLFQVHVKIVTTCTLPLLLQTGQAL